MHRYIDSRHRALGGQAIPLENEEKIRGRCQHELRKAGRIAERLALAAILVVVGFAPQGVSAATAAYWRHEEGPSGQIVPDGLDTVLDSSGNEQHMQTFSSAAAPFTAATYSPLVSPLALRSGLDNNLSLDFGPSPTIGIEDGADPMNGNGKNDDNYTSSKTIHTQLFTAMTVELAFNMHAVNNSYQTLFGKDGKPLGDDPNEPDSPIAPLQIKVRGDDFPGGVLNQLFVEWIDGDGDIHFLNTGTSVTTNTWNHVAFTLTATAAELWVAGETGDYVLLDAVSGGDFAGTSGEVIIFEPLGFTIGRGMYNNGVTDWSDALIDEVRLSDTALSPTEFLFETAPIVENANFDGDSDIDGNDFLTWQRNAGGAGSQSDGDANGDGLVNGADLAIWENQYGGPLPVSAVAAVPEPASLMLMGGLLMVAFAAPRTSRRFSKGG